MSVELRVSYTGIKKTVLSCDFCGFSFTQKDSSALEIRRYIANRKNVGRMGRNWPVLGGWIKDYANRNTLDYCRDYCVHRAAAKSKVLGGQRTQHRA